MKNMSDFIKSDYCRECDGDGTSEENEQCESCEELHQQELRADRMHDEMKGN